MDFDAVWRTLEEESERAANGVYDSMVDAMFPANQETASYTQEGFYTWRLFGSPYMLLDDPPLGEITNSGFLGEWYINQLRQSQILTLKLGVPKYTGNSKGVNLVDWVNGAAQGYAEGKGTLETAIDSVMAAAIGQVTTGLNEAKRYYTFYNQYEIYIQYVRLLIVELASYLGVMNYPIPALDDSGMENYQYVTIKDMDWTTYTTAGGKPISMKDIFRNIGDTIGISDWFSDASQRDYRKVIEGSSDGTASLQKDNHSNFADTYYDVAGGPPAIVQFIVQPNYATDRFSNDLTESQAAQKAASSYDMGREVAWIANTTGESSFTGAVSEVIGAGATGVQTALDGVQMDPFVSIMGSSVVGMLRGLAGERMIFPKIYDKSEFSHSFPYTMRLASPFGDAYSYFINIGLPLCYLIPAVAPKTASVNAYKMPFMCQAYVTGQTAIPMAIITEMSLTRGASGAMNKDGLPLEVEVNLTISDLYSNMAVSAISDAAQFLSNDSLIEYMASLTPIETWNRAKLNTYLASDIASEVKQEAFDVEKNFDRIQYNLSEYAGNQLRMYGIADAAR